MALRDALDNLARDLHLPQPPFWMVSAALIFVVAPRIRPAVRSLPVTVMRYGSDRSSGPLSRKLMIVR